MSKQEKLSPMMKQFLAIKEEYKDCILFFRLGDFYELFNEDAILGSKELDLTLTGKDCGTDERAPMCGVPYHAYESYAEKLLEKGYKVAICEQTDELINGLVQRKVIRVITPGTVIDSAMLNDSNNTYIMCIKKSKDTISYVYSDISTGEISAGEYTGSNLISYINDQIVRVVPSEIICNEEFLTIANYLPCVQANDKFKFNSYYEWAFSYSNAEKNILSQFNLTSVKGYDFDKKNMIEAIGALLEYFKETQKRDLKHLRLPKVMRDNQFMYIDTNTRRNLELEVSTHTNTKQGSLLWVLDKTETSGGARMLRSWIRQPLQSKAEIDKRLNMVSELYSNANMSANLSSVLSNIQDIERFAGRISYKSINPKECLALAYSLGEIPKIKDILSIANNENLRELGLSLPNVTSLVTLIRSAIDEEATTNVKDGNCIRKGFNAELDNLKEMKNNAVNYILQLQAKEREETGIKNLKIGYNRVFGYYIEVSKMNVDRVPFRYIRKQTLTNGERYITEELKKFEEDVLSSSEKALKLESLIYDELVNQLSAHIVELQNIANIISLIDCVNSFAVVANDNNYTRPKITDDNTIDIELGRHPVVEKVMKGEDFIPNDCLLNNSDQRTMILTGPNMAGKSTYMREVALITFMAHIGSFVPAKSANVCIVDRIFTRIGASDDLAVGQSTFMVEMIEVSNILNYATNNSLIILDEVGRGTSTFDGLSIAWAVVEYLSKHLNAKTLFATHYHELMQMEGKYDGVKNFCISIKEIGGKLVFLRKIMRGSATKSYGIEVASLAGLPNDIIDRAKELMNEFEQEKMGGANLKESEITNILREIDVNKLTPLVAFDTLLHLKDLIK